MDKFFLLHEKIRFVFLWPNFKFKFFIIIFLYRGAEAIAL